MKIIKLNAKRKKEIKKQYPYAVYYKVDGREIKTDIKFHAYDQYNAENIAMGKFGFHDYPNAYVKLDEEELALKREKIDAIEKRKKMKQENVRENLGNNWWDN